MKIDRSRAIRNLLTTYIKLHGVVTKVIYFYLIREEDSNRKNDGRKIGKKVMQG
jgi:hypothetical protein